MIPFNKPYMTGRELWYIAQAHANGHLSGDGPFTRRCHTWLQQHTGAGEALLTHSCTAALEMAALLLDLQPGDEVIMPSYTFVSTANAFVLRGAVPVFVDIRKDTFNIDERLIEAAITARTKAICVVHYAGVACEMDPILDIAQRHGLKIVEDAAQAIFSRYKDRPLGGIGDFGCLSFHETKNLISGEGGALLVRDPMDAKRAEILREKGTNRSQFFRGQVDKYTWVDVGSSYLPSELIAAFLQAQIDDVFAEAFDKLAVQDGCATLGLAFGLTYGLSFRDPFFAEQREFICKHGYHLFEFGYVGYLYVFAQTLSEHPFGPDCQSPTQA